MVLRSQPEKVEQVEADIEAFEVDMKRVLKVRGEGGGGGVVRGTNSSPTS